MKVRSAVKRATLFIALVSFVFGGVSLHAATSTVTGKVNINTANVAKLMQIPGVGAAKAKAIIAARPFQKPSDLTRVKGIGPKLFAKMEGFVATSGETTIQKVKATKPGVSGAGR